MTTDLDRRHPARNVRPRSLLTALDVIAAQLHDFPRTLAIIDAGRCAVTTATTSPHNRTTKDNT
ncbi:hypothetical protein [Streptacidiphilus sp. PAMC 29251]